MIDIIPQTSYLCHCERSEAIQKHRGDCFGRYHSLAM